MKHNKKRNTAFIYESLVKELTKAIVDKDVERKNTIFSLIQECFVPSSPLAEELVLYKTLLETKKSSNYKKTLALLFSKNPIIFSNLNK